MLLKSRNKFDFKFCSKIVLYYSGEICVFLFTETLKGCERKLYEVGGFQTTGDEQDVGTSACTTPSFDLVTPQACFSGNMLR
jgi:hypothetical protein